MSGPRKFDPERKPVSILLEIPLYDGLRRVAEAEHRTMAGELRHLIELRIAEHDAEQPAAA